MSWVNIMLKVINWCILCADHGKTSLVNQLSQYCDPAQTASMDSHPLERERGITILAKCTSVTHNDTLFNIVDTPGHADFGGEVR
jgi:GTP-binding protein